MSHHIEIKQLNSHGGQKINMKISITTQIDRLTIRDSFGSTFKKFYSTSRFSKPDFRQLGSCEIIHYVSENVSKSHCSLRWAGFNAIG